MQGNLTPICMRVYIYMHIQYIHMYLESGMTMHSYDDSCNLSVGQGLQYQESH